MTHFSWVLQQLQRYFFTFELVFVWKCLSYHYCFQFSLLLILYITFVGFWKRCFRYFNLIFDLLMILCINFCFFKALKFLLLQQHQYLVLHLQKTFGNCFLLAMCYLIKLCLQCLLLRLVVCVLLFRHLDLKFKTFR